MCLNNNTVPSNTSATEFKYFAGIAGYSNDELNSLCSSVLGKDFESSWNSQNYMEQKYSNPFKVLTDSWTVDLSISDGKLYHNLPNQLGEFIRCKTLLE